MTRRFIVKTLANAFTAQEQSPRAHAERLAEIAAVTLEGLGILKPAKDPAHENGCGEAEDA